LQLFGAVISGVTTAICVCAEYFVYLELRIKIVVTCKIKHFYIHGIAAGS